MKATDCSFSNDYDQFDHYIMGECGWQAVRHVVPGTTWFEANDRLAGTSVYGTPNDNSNNWSIKFDHITFNQFLFVTGDK